MPITLYLINDKTTFSPIFGQIITAHARFRRNSTSGFKSNRRFWISDSDFLSSLIVTITLFVTFMISLRRIQMFLLTYLLTYLLTSHRFGAIVTQSVYFAKFLDPCRIQRVKCQKHLPLRSYELSLDFLDSTRYIVWWKPCDPRFNRFDTTPSCDGRTDWETSVGMTC